MKTTTPSVSFAIRRALAVGVAALILFSVAVRARSQELHMPEMTEHDRSPIPAWCIGDDRTVVFEPKSTPAPRPISKGASEQPVGESPKEGPPATSLNARHSLSSYSFDSREWVDQFSAATGSDPLIPELAVPPSVASGSDPFSSNQVWSLSGRPAGEVRLATAAPEKIEGRAPAVPKRFDDEPAPLLDLSPSYSKTLKHVEVCGVVVVQANFPLTEIQSILSEIERLQRDLTLYMGVPRAREKIELCLFKDEKSFQKFLQERFPRAPKDRRALYIKLNNEPGSLLVQRSKEFDIDLRHEMTHAIIHASIPTVPIWLDEGLAKYFEVPVQERAEKNPYIKTIRWNVKFGAVPSLRRLERLEDISEMTNREYRDSWAWVHFMIHHSPQTHRLLAGYLQLLFTIQDEAAKAGKPIREHIDLPTLSPYLNDVVEKPREQYRQHFQTWGIEPE